MIKLLTHYNNFYKFKLDLRKALIKRPFKEIQMTIYY